MSGPGVKWTTIDGYQDLPTGEWLVKLSGGSHHVARVSPSLTTVGGSNGNRMRAVIAYMPIPTDNEESGE